jgi:hypothetical protein
MESLALVVSIMILISILGAPIGWLILKIPTHNRSTTNFKRLAAFIFTLFGLMLGLTILSTGPAIGGVVIAIFSFTTSILVLIKIWRDKTYWEH